MELAFLAALPVPYISLAEPEIRIPFSFSFWLCRRRRRYLHSTMHSFVVHSRSYTCSGWVELLYHSASLLHWISPLFTVG